MTIEGTSHVVGLLSNPFAIDGSEFHNVQKLFACHTNTNLYSPTAALSVTPVLAFP